MRYIYDLMADLVGYVRPNGYDPGGYYSAAERYTNDAFHRRLSRTDCTGAVYAVHRDGEGNIIKEISPNAYDSRTNDGAGIEYIYDDYDRAVRVCCPDGGILRRWYDPAGNLVKTYSPTQYDPASDSGAGYTYEYDSMGRLVDFRFFKKLTGEGAIIILPTSRKENVSGPADSVIQIHSPRFE